MNSIKAFYEAENSANLPCQGEPQRGLAGFMINVGKLKKILISKTGFIKPSFIPPYEGGCLRKHESNIDRKDQNF